MKTVQSTDPYVLNFILLLILLKLYHIIKKLF